MFESATTIPLANILTIVFYLIVAFFTLSSAIALYSLIRFGKDKVIVMGVTATYIIIATTLFIIARSQLNNIEF